MTKLTQSETITELLAAMSKAQGAIKNPAKDKANPHFKSKYADLASGLVSARPVLSANGLSVIQVTEIHENSVFLRTRLAHSSGQWIDGFYPVASIGLDHQKLGAAMTYAKRQALFAIIGISADDDDDDGNLVGGVEAGSQRKTVQHKEPVVAPLDRLLTAMRKSDSAISLGEWMNHPKVKSAVDLLNADDAKAFSDASKARLEIFEQSTPFNTTEG